MVNIFTQLLYRPLFNLLVFLYNIIPGHDFGLAIIALTLVVRLILSPLSIRAGKSQRAMTRLSPELQAIREKFKDNKEQQSKAMMELYKKNNINPFLGCLPLLIQLPILIALYQAFLAGFKPESLNLLYPFVHNPGAFNTTSLGIITITAKSHILAIAAGVLQFVQAKVSLGGQPQGGKQDPTTSALNTQMMYFLPIMIIVITWNFSAGLALYWVTTTLFSIAEQWYIRYKYS